MSKTMQTYDDGTPIIAGDSIQMIRSGGLLPGYTARGVAGYGEGLSAGVLYLCEERCTRWGDPSTAYTARMHINHGGNLTKL